ncbi:hypothetical protein HAV22_26890 [Massilia sp. TW-1]|uniref:Uncharacterized protein n=1 Tax=Telluria antibiotica TaxID=2717319 RepID=A0ABX0PL81_9BURK|nr:hypothetical protein [Telluria antibiotica]
MPRAARRTGTGAARVGIEHRVRPDGTVAVMRAHAEKVFGAVAAGGRRAAPKEPDWGALDAARA